MRRLIAALAVLLCGCAGQVDLVIACKTACEGSVDRVSVEWNEIRCYCAKTLPE